MIQQPLFPEAEGRAPEKQLCGACAGAGEVLLDVHLVTARTASDADNPALEGQERSRYGPCPACGGSGFLPLPERSRS